MASLFAALAGRLRDRGAATTVVSVVLGTGVLLGTGAVVVDVGQLYVEREEVQSGADAAAYALALTCAKTPASCSSQTTKATSVANQNASDSKTRVTAICGTGQGLPACPPAPDNLTRCIGTPPGAPYVEVRTATLTADGKSALPPSFARALAGDDGYDGDTVMACARAAWGRASTVHGAGVTLSTCDWQSITGNGAKLAAPPPASPSGNAEGVIYLHGTNNASSCAPSNSGWQAPGGFGWLDDTGGGCTATVQTDGTYGGSTGASASSACEAMLSAARANRTVLWMPVFGGVTNTGSNIVYKLTGVSGFVVTGYSLPGFSAKSTLPPYKDLCTGSDKCIYGYFTTGLLPMSSALSASTTNYGVLTIAMVG